MGINLKKVSYSYNSSKKYPIYAIEDISLNIDDKDEFIALIGHTGSGKSTLATIFNALKVPTLGEATINSITLRKVRRIKDKYNNIRHHVGLVFQFPDFQLFEETVIKDVAFGPKNFGHKKEAIELANKALDMVHFPIDKREESPFILSGGEKKLVSIAGILAVDPDIIVLDEPTSGLDPKAKDNIMGILKELNETYGKSIVIITHDMNTVYKYAKRVLLMNKGSLIADLTPEDLFIHNKALVKETHLELPDVIRIRDYIENRFHLGLKENPKSLDELGGILNE